MRKVGFVVATILLLVSGGIGLRNGVREWNDPGTTLMKAVHVAVVLYGILGVLGAVGLWRRRRWSVTIAAGWAISVVCAATIASFAFHDPRLEQEGTLVGVVASGVATALIGAFVVWIARRETRSASSEAATSPPT